MNWRNVAYVVLVIALILAIINFIWGFYKTIQEEQSYRGDKSVWFNLFSTGFLVFALVFVLGILLFTSEFGKRAASQARDVLSAYSRPMTSRRRDIA